MAGRESLSRRDLIKYTAVGSFGVVAGGVIESIRSQEPPHAYFDFNEYVQDYPGVREERAERLVSSVEFNTLALELVSDENAFVSSFDADPQKLYGIEIRGMLDPEISIQGVKVIVGDHEYLAPVIQSVESALCHIYIGEMEGEQAIRFESLKEGETPIVSANLLEISADPFAREVIRNIPNLHIRKDNEDDPLNDVPLNSNVYFRENFLLGNMRMAEYWMRYSGESNPHAPHPLAEEVGRVWDEDVVSMMKTNGAGERREAASMGKGHLIYIDKQFGSPELLPWGERVEHQIIERNNMVSSQIEVGMSCSFIPDQLLNFPDKIKFDRDKAIMVLSIREYVSEGRLREDDPFVQSVIANELDGENLISR